MPVMKKLLNDFFDRYFHDEESIILLILLSIGLAVLLLLGEILAPLIAAIIIAYLMQGLVNLLLSRMENATEAIVAYSIYYRVALFALNPIIAISAHVMT